MSGCEELEAVMSITLLGCWDRVSPTDPMGDDLDARESRLVSMEGLSSIDGSVRVRPSIRLAMGLLGFA
jgi:hypothetical protein